MIPPNVMPRGCACTGQCLRGTCPAVSGESAALTLRDHFATHAMQALILKTALLVEATLEDGSKLGDKDEFMRLHRAGIATGAYQYADSMLVERGRSESKPQTSPQVSGSIAPENSAGTNSYGGTE